MCYASYSCTVQNMMTVYINEFLRNQITDDTYNVCFHLDPKLPATLMRTRNVEKIHFLRFRLLFSRRRISLVLRVGNHLTILKHSMPPQKYNPFFYTGVNTLSRATGQATPACIAFAFYSLARRVSGTRCLH